MAKTVSLPSGAQTQQKKSVAIKEELDRTVKFYNSSHAEKPLGTDIPVFVSGEMVKESEIGATLAGRLKAFAVPLLSPLKYHRALPPSRYMVNIGLALKEISLPKTKAHGSVVSLNAVPEAYQPKPRSLVEILFIPGIIIAIALLVPPVMFVQRVTANTASLQTQLNITNQRYNKAQVQKKAVTELEKKVGNLEAACGAFTGALDHFSQQHEGINNDLNKL
ncbi:hypothetical protein ACFLV4_05920 [Chloroflexota bacterium]